MKILKLEVQGFRSFSALQSLDFSTMQPGLYHVTGKNNVEPELEANGAGKSSLFESVFWALYGKTSRNLKAKTVKHWTSDEKCAAVLDLQTTSGAMSLLRTWGPNALEVSGKAVGERPIEQTNLENLIELSPEAFLFSVYFAQFSPAFVDLSPAEQTTVFSTVLNLELWERASALASENAKETESKIQQLREATARIQGQAEELLSQDYSMAEKQWKKEHGAELRVAEDALTIKQQTLKALDAEAGVYQKVKEAADKQQKVVTEATLECRQLAMEIEKLSKQNITKCPTCGQSVNRQHIKKELDRVKAVFKEREAARVKEAKKYVSLSESIPDDYDLRQQTADREFQFAAAKMFTIKSKINPYTKLREEQEQRGEQLAKQLEESEAELATAEKQVKATQYWVKGFKEVRLSLIRESLTQLTVEVNEVLFQLGLQDWGVEFDIERENKSGSINRSFTVMVRSPHTEDAVPWEVWSGGESQRLRVAISMGFANLITSRLGVQPNLELWDEPSTWLSEAGIQDLLSVLATRAERQKKVILLADHRALDFGGFAGTISVIKDQDGSRITV